MLSAALRRTTTLAHKANTNCSFRSPVHCRPGRLSLRLWQALGCLSTLTPAADTDYLQLGVKLSKKHGHPTKWSEEVVTEWLSNKKFMTLADVVTDGDTIPTLDKDVDLMKTLEAKDVRLVRKLQKAWARLCVSVAAFGEDFNPAATAVPQDSVYTPSRYKYVDKTKYLRRILLDTPRCLILTGPRRFGKSTALDMLNYMIQGSANMFETPGPLDGFWEHWAEYTGGSQSSVRAIHLDLTQVSNKASLVDHMRTTAAEHHGIALPEGKDPPRLLQLWVSNIEKRGYKAALLIDEYDKGAMLALTEGDGHDGTDKAQHWVREVLAPLLSETKLKRTPLVKVVCCGVATFAVSDAGSGANHFESPFDGHGDLVNVLGYTAEEVVATYPEAATNLVNYRRGLQCEEAISATSELQPADVRSVLAEEHNGWRLKAHAQQSFSPFVLNVLLTSPGSNKTWMGTGYPNIIEHQWRRRRLIGADILKGDLVIDTAPPAPMGMSEYFAASSEATTQMALDFGFLTFVTRAKAEDTHIGGGFEGSKNDALASLAAQPRMAPIGIPNDLVRKALAKLWLDHYKATPKMVADLGALLTQVPDADDGSLLKHIGSFVGGFAINSRVDHSETLKEEACKWLLFQHLELYSPAVTRVHVEQAVAGRGCVDATIHWSQGGQQYALMVVLGMAARRANLDTKLRDKVEQMKSKENLQSIAVPHPAGTIIKGLAIVVRHSYPQDGPINYGVEDVRVQRCEFPAADMQAEKKE